jgi:hypothetical protein
MTWTVRLHTIPSEKTVEITQYCLDAAKKDPTFKFTIEAETNLETGATKPKFIIIECPSRDNAFERGVLFHHRFSCFFEVEWVKNNGASSTMHKENR